MNGGQKRIISRVAGRKEEKILYFVTGFVLISSLVQELNSHVASFQLNSSVLHIQPSCVAVYFCFAF